MTSSGTYTFVPHTADIQFMVSAPDARSALRSAAAALYRAVGTLEANVSGTEERTFVYAEAGQDTAIRARDFLADLLGALTTEGVIMVDILGLSLSPEAICITALFAPLDQQRSLFDREVKAVTYSDLSWKAEADRITFRCVLDI